MRDSSNNAVLVEDQSNIQPGGPIGNLLGATPQEFQGLIDNDMFDIAELLAGRKPFSIKCLFSWNQT